MIVISLPSIWKNKPAPTPGCQNPTWCTPGTVWDSKSSSWVLPPTLAPKALTHDVSTDPPKSTGYHHIKKTIEALNSKIIELNLNIGYEVGDIVTPTEEDEIKKFGQMRVERICTALWQMDHHFILDQGPACAPMSVLLRRLDNDGTVRCTPNFVEKVK